MSDPEEQKACLACGNAIPASAFLCTHCETYQDWRRHISIGNSTLALLIAFLALIGPATEKVFGVYREFQLESSKKVEYALVDISKEAAQVLVSNRSSGTIVVNRFQCLMLLPYDRNYYFDGQEAVYGVMRWPRGEETIGTVLVTYKIEEPLVLKKGEQAYTEFPRTHVTPAKANRVGSQDDAISICTLGAMNDTNSLEGDAAFLNPGDLISFDALEIVEDADYSLFQEPDRQALLTEIRKVREEASRSDEP